MADLCDGVPPPISLPFKAFWHATFVVFATIAGWTKIFNIGLGCRTDLFSSVRVRTLLVDYTDHSMHRPPPPRCQQTTSRHRRHTDSRSLATQSVSSAASGRFWFERSLTRSFTRSLDRRTDAASLWRHWRVPDGRSVWVCAGDKPRRRLCQPTGQRYCPEVNRFLNFALLPCRNSPEKSADLSASSQHTPIFLKSQVPLKTHICISRIFRRVHFISISHNSVYSVITASEAWRLKRVSSMFITRTFQAEQNTRYDTIWYIICTEKLTGKLPV